MPIAKLRKEINLFIDGRGYAGRVTEFDPPKLLVKTEEHRAGGMDAPLEIDMGLEKLECMLTLADADALRLFGLIGDAKGVTLRGAQQGRDGTLEALVYQPRGRFRETDAGAWKAGEASPLKLTDALEYYKLEVGGETIHEIDVVNTLRVIDGTDQMEAMRQALGL